MRRVVRDESGLTLVELLVASAMSVILVGAVGSMVISTVRTQPQVSKRAQNVSTARWVLERMTREIRNGIRVDVATASKVSFVTYVRHTPCGGSTPLSSGAAPVKCEVTYECTTTYCSRIEASEGVYTGTARKVISGINSSSVFCFVPSTEKDSLACGTAASVSGTTYIGATLRIPNPSGPANLTVSDGASLRNATLVN
jgi:type II secretory pathway pseudopilin PulG